ncbi:DNA-processing protein DprA [Pseudoteredinibacter isoporae]|uniref:DNA-processing protein DprA n=1 Tax=Pseudoteredinibacter isoporae TaxID=570281 RepID=UPI0031033F78
MQNSSLLKDQFLSRIVSPTREMAAYEALWEKDSASFKKLADKFKSCDDCLPSDLVSEREIEQALLDLNEILEEYKVGKFGIRVNRLNEYPDKLRDARNPIEVLYYQGFWNLIETPCVAVVGARNVSSDGVRRTRKLVKMLVKDGFTIVSGLAEGVDKTAHLAAIEYGGQTIGVIGTPLSHCYPKTNAPLQRLIKENYLLLSQVPFKKYLSQDYRINRSFFPERNITMSALTQATIIVEASDTSGTLYQARAAIAQGRKLFILDSCFLNPAITWPEKYLKKGAIRVKDYEDIRKELDLDVRESYSAGC